MADRVPALAFHLSPQTAAYAVTSATWTRMLLLAFRGYILLIITGFALTTVFYAAERVDGMNWSSNLGDIEFRVRLGHPVVVWDKWSSRPWWDSEWFGVPFVVTIIVVAGTTVLTTLMLPYAARTDAPGRSIATTLRCVIAAYGPIALLGFAAGTLVGLAACCEVTYAAGTMGASYRALGGPIVAWTVPLAVALILRWVSLTIMAVDPGDQPTARTWTCEGCGYDLTHRPEGGFCTECGLPLAQSLDEPVARPGIAWESGKYEPQEWLHTGWRAFSQPRDFYRRLKCRTDASVARSFARRHLVAIALAAPVWFSVGVVPSLGLPQQRVDLYASMALVIMFAVPLAGWVTRQVCMLVALIITAMRRISWDVRGVRKVLGYETVWLWLFCAWNGSLIALLIRSPQRLLMDMSWTYAVFGIPPEPFVIFAGNAVLILLWIIRLVRIERATRWANF